MGFNEVTAAGMSFSENSDVFGETFTYSNVSLVGVFNQVDIEYEFQEFSFRRQKALICVTSKPQWVAAGLTPVIRDPLTYGGAQYYIEGITGKNTGGEPAYQLTLFELT